jgi:ArsR family transcriptional regulator
MIAACDEACSCELLAPLGKAQPTVSHHTKALADAGLIVGEKRGRWVYWRAVPARLATLRDALAP